MPEGGQEWGGLGEMNSLLISSAYGGVSFNVGAKLGVDNILVAYVCM